MPNVVSPGSFGNLQTVTTVNPLPVSIQGGVSVGDVTVETDIGTTTDAATGVGANTTVIGGLRAIRDAILNAIPTSKSGAGNFKAAVAESLPTGANTIGKVQFDATSAGNTVQAADGGVATIGATTDSAWSGSGAGGVVALLKAIWAKFGAGFPAALSASGNLKTAVAESLPTGTNSIGTVVLGSNSVVNTYTGAITALSSPPATTTANSDTTFTFSSTIHHIMFQNNSANPVYINFDAAATLGVTAVPANGAIASFDIPCTAVHLYATAALNVNGSVAGHLVLLGWA